MISGFLTSLSVPSDHAKHIEERLTLIIDFYHLLLRHTAAKRLISRTNRVSTDVADKHARYISRDCYLVRRSRGHDDFGDNGAHCCVDYCFCKRTAIISAAKVRHCKRKGLPRCLVPLPREWLASKSCFSGIFMSYPNKGICSIW